MSSTSDHAGRVELPSEFSGDDDQFCDPVYLLDGLINGLNHLGDEWAQVRINFNAPDPDLMGGTATDGPLEPDGFAEDWTLLAAWSFPVTVLDGPTQYRLRLRVAAGVGGTPADCDLRVVVAPYGTPISRLLVDEETDAVWEADAFASATPGDLTGATRGDAAYADAIELPATLDGPLAVVVALFVRASSDQGTPQVWTLYLSEVCPEAP